MFWNIFLTAWGWAAILADNESISATVLPTPYPLPSLYKDIESTGHKARLIAINDSSQTAVSKFRSYYEGALIEDWEMTLRLDTFSSFSRQVMELVHTIPYGQTITYAEAARAVGKPGAARAIGQVMKRNPMPLIIPCHRVVASNGPGGFTSPGGVQTKLEMLQWERQNLALKKVTLD
jgi:methylated-DNA-[protein]-cysteine S-methyltransferase